MLTFLTDATPTGGINSWYSIILIVGMLVVLYFFMIRPQRKQEKETNAMRSNLAVGDEIVTIGGIIGIIISISSEDTVTIVTSRDRTRLHILKSAVSRVQVPVNAPADAKDKDGKDKSKDDKDSK